MGDIKKQVCSLRTINRADGISFFVSKRGAIASPAASA
jgi:hypothetical protein